MEEPLFRTLSAWVSSSHRSLSRLGWTIFLEEQDDPDSPMVLELENRRYIGRLQLQDTGRLELGVRDKDTDTIRRGECEVYTEGQLKDAVSQFLGWLDQSSTEVQQVQPKKCPHNKTIYLSRKDAREVLERMIIQKGTKAIVEYRCTMCHWWHIGGAYGKVANKRRSFSK